MEAFLGIGILLVVSGGLLILYATLPKPKESAHPIRDIFGTQTFLESPEALVENATNQYTLLGNLFSAKNIALEHFAAFQNLTQVVHARQQMEICFNDYLSAVHSAAGMRGVPVDTHAQIVLIHAQELPKVIEKEQEAFLKLEMYLYQQSHEAGRKYYELKAEKASRRELNAQKQLWEELKREWQDISTQRTLRKTTISQLSTKP